MGLGEDLVKSDPPCKMSEEGGNRVDWAVSLPLYAEDVVTIYVSILGGFINKVTQDLNKTGLA